MAWTAAGRPTPPTVELPGQGEWCCCCGATDLPLVAALSEYYLERARAHGVALDDAAVLQLLAMDIELNAQGLETWLERSRLL